MIKTENVDKQGLFNKELSNLYAIAKQANHYFDGSDIYFLSERVQQMLMDYLKLICQTEEMTSEALDQMDVNPTNTKDSIVEEITENLRQIADQDLDESVKALSYQMSLNRLMAYHLANMENIALLGKDEKGLQPLIALRKELSSKKELLFA